MDALLAVAKQRQLTAQGRRDYAMLLFLYNSGARADEAAELKIADLHFTAADWNGQPYVQIHGKGGRTRQCPLWPVTVREINSFTANRQPPNTIPKKTNTRGKASHSKKRY
jgi:integrase/recombinase XerD